jgi:hypothetical protein
MGIQCTYKFKQNKINMSGITNSTKKSMRYNNYRKNL